MYADANKSIQEYVPYQPGNSLLEALRKADETMKEYAKIIDYSAKARERFRKLHDEDCAARTNRAGPYAPHKESLPYGSS